MHGKKALEQIEDKINDEHLSNEEDEDDLDNCVTSSDYSLIPDPSTF